MSQYFLFFFPFVSVPALSNALLVLGNARIYTVDETKPWAEAIAIDDNGIIVGVGSETEIMPMFNPSSGEYIDLEQRMVLPGFQDAHLHAVEAGVFDNLCFIPENVDVRDVPFILNDECEDGGEFGDQGWIVGVGIDLVILLESFVERPNLPYPIQVLDDAYPDTPVLIIDNLGHGVVANTRAFEMVGYDTLQGNPPGGILDRDPFTNEPTGVVLEDAQQRLRDASFPPTTTNTETAYQGLLQSLEFLAANGITTVSDAGGFWRQAQTESWVRAESEGRLTLRASNCLYVYPDTPIQEQTQDLTSRFTNDPNALLRFNQAKVYVDGILSLATAALYEPYLDVLDLPQGSELGFEYFGTEQTLSSVTQALVDAGFQLNFHVLGDRGAGLALNAIEQASITLSGIHHRLTHVYLVAEQDRPRFEALKVVADFQLTPGTATLDYQDFLATDLIGSQRASTLMPIMEIHETGALVTISSDWDTDSVSPLLKLSTLLTRENGQPVPDLETAIKMMTINPAKLLQHDDRTGSLELNKFADIVILDQDIFAMDPAAIRNAQIEATLLQGDAVYDPEGLFGPSKGSRSPTPTSSAAWQRWHIDGSWWYTTSLVLSAIMYLH